MEAYDSDDASLALGLMEASAKTGDPVACYLTALWYGNGEGTAPNPERRTYWMRCLQRMAEEGNLEAQWELSGKYRWGDLLPLDVEQANHWLERAAERGHGAAQHHLAWYYETGQYDYLVDPDAAAVWYRRAFEQENPETLYLFAVKQFKDGQPTDEAIQLLRKAASKGFKQAEHVLAEFTH